MEQLIKIGLLMMLLRVVSGCNEHAEPVIQQQEMSPSEVTSAISPEKSVSVPSGLDIGEDDPSFTPYHAFGPDKGTWTCPLCKYGGYHGILYFVGNHPDWSDIRKWVVFLEQESVSRPDYLKAFFVYGNENDFNAEARQKELEDLGTELDIQNVALTFVPSMTDTATEVFFNKINPDVGNTFIIYQQGEIVDKYVDIEANADNFNRIVSTIDKPTMTEILNVKAPSHQ